MAKITHSVLIKNLMDFGLGKKEAQVYLSLLELEIANVSELAKHADVNRSSTYVVLESLKEKGLVSVSEDQNVQNYVATSPDMLLFEAQNKALKAQEVKNNISDIVPELKALHKDTKQRPKVRVFEGKQGLITALNDSLDNKTKIMRECSATENYFQKVPEATTAYIEKRIELGIKLYGIHPDTTFEDKITEMFPKLSKLDKSIFIPQKKYQFPSDIVIYDNRIAYFSPNKKGFAIIIESQEMADVMKSVFDLAYAQAKQVTKINHLVTGYKKSFKK